MKFRPLFLALMLVFAPFAMAETLVTEDFDYTISTPITSCGSWMLQYGGDSHYTITSGLEFYGYEGCGKGGAALLDGKFSNDQPHLPFTKVESGTVYVAFMLQPSIVYKKGYFFCLRDDKISTSEFNFNARVSLNEDYQLGFTFADNQKAEYMTQSLDYQSVYLVVIKYVINEYANNDEASLYVFKAGDVVDDMLPFETEPSAPAIGPVTDASKPDIKPANVVLRGFDADGWVVVDGIRVATSWSEAVKVNKTSDCGLLADVEKAQTDDEIIAVYDLLGNYLGDSLDALAADRIYIVRSKTGTRCMRRCTLGAENASR